MAGYKNPKPSVDDKITKTAKDEVAKISYEKYGSDYEHKKTVFFAFIDVLGFKKAFDDHREDESEGKVQDIKFADKFKEVFIYYFELINASKLSSWETTGCYAGQTSDSLYFYSPREDLLIEYIQLFLHFNLFAMSKNVFFRGGIAKGNLFVKQPHQFYGESVIYSYLLESVISRFPIIVIDENTYTAIKNYPKTDLLIKKDKNDRYYLNIFAPLQSGFFMDFRDEMFTPQKIDINKVLENIKQNRKKFEYDAKNYEKYGFLMKEYQKYIETMNIHSDIE